MFFAIMALASAALQTGSLEEASKSFDDAQLHHDRAAIEAFLAPDFQYVTRKGKLLGRKEFIEATTTQGETLDPFVIADHRVMHLGAGGGIASGDARVKGTQDGKALSDRFRYADIFEHRNGRWIVVYTQVTTPVD
ncbi:MAG TPA: nuclear transport factor 2 family protein [Rhizomicrobium sp.]|nr:nuclear transport factor 2 family protein [Rhizomicrobium sp.]